MDEDTSCPGKKELIILKLPQDEVHRNRVYSELSQVIGKPPWARDTRENKDLASTEYPQYDPMDIDSETPIRTSRAQPTIDRKGKQRDYLATSFYSANETIAAAAETSAGNPQSTDSAGLTDYHTKNQWIPSATSGSVSRVAPSVSLNQETAESDDLLGFLAVVEHRKIDILPLHWDNTDSIGCGGTANISKGVKVATTKGDNLGFVFKRTQSQAKYEDPAQVFRSVLSEVYILGHPVVQQHPNINSLEGICWETIHGRPWPVLIFKQAPYGDLGKFMRTKEARGLTFQDKIKLCWEMGNALQLMHSCNAIHGDMKPENVLICKDSDGKFSAQVTDFGYSTIFANDNDKAKISLPRSWPWTAPEIEQGSWVTFEQAKAADIFSYGLLCFWLLCYDSVSKHSSDWAGPSRDFIQDIKRTSCFSQTATEIVKYDLDITKDNFLQAWALDLFFSRTLSSDQGKRELDVDTLPEYFGLPVQPSPLMEQFGESYLLKSKASFTLPALLSRLIRCPRDVRKEVFERLIERTSRDTDTGFSKSEENDTYSNYQLLAFNIALCYELGLGTEKCSEEANSWRQRGNCEQFQNVLDMVRSDTNGLYSAYEYLPHSLNTTGGGLNSSTRERWAIEVSVPWISKVLGQETNGYTPKVIDMSNIFHQNRSDIMTDIANGHNKKGFFVSWMQLACSSDTSNYDYSSQDSHLIVFPTISAENVGYQESLKEEQGKVHLSLEAKKRAIGSTHQDTLQDLDKLRILYSRTSQPSDKVVVLWEELLSLQQEMFGYMSPSTLKSAEGLARLYIQRNELRKAYPLVKALSGTARSLFGDSSGHALESLGLLESFLSAAAHVGGFQQDDHEMYSSLLLYTSIAQESSNGGSKKLPFKTSLGRFNIVMGSYAGLLCRQPAIALFGPRPQFASDPDLEAVEKDPQISPRNYFSSSLTKFEGSIKGAEKDPTINQTEVLYAKLMLACGHIILCFDEAIEWGERALSLKKAYQIQADIYMQGYDLQSLPAQNPHFILNPDMKKQGDNLWAITQGLLRTGYFQEDFLHYTLREYIPGDPSFDDRTRLLPPVKRDPDSKYPPRLLVLVPRYSSDSVILMGERLVRTIDDGDLDIDKGSVADVHSFHIYMAYLEGTISPEHKNIDRAIEVAEQLLQRADNDEKLIQRIICLKTLLEARYRATRNIKDLQATVLLTEQLTYPEASTSRMSSGFTSLDWLWQLSKRLQKIWWQLKDDDTFVHLVKVQRRLISRGKDPHQVLEAWLLLTTVELRHLLEDASNTRPIRMWLENTMMFLQIFFVSGSGEKLKTRNASKLANGEPSSTFNKEIAMQTKHELALMTLVAIYEFLLCFLPANENSCIDRGSSLDRALICVSAALKHAGGGGLLEPFLKKTRDSIASVKIQFEGGMGFDLETKIPPQFFTLFQIYFPEVNSHGGWLPDWYLLSKQMVSAPFYAYT
ncbi:hypothetical protein TWF730_000205 [Orbilia blumenaviensis]|uniref:Protein kinase domain-containing protein n=1 Tax=Orbilia blumenaviensis TaxID=1796055 RepID=A0AAV9VKU4_9PEZI